MSLQDWAALLLKQLKETPVLLWLSTIFAIAEVLFARANKIWLYPTGIAATLISAYIMFKAGLFAESLLNLYYFFMSIYGWWTWVKKKNKTAISVSYATKNENLIALLICFIGTGFLYWVLKCYTTSTVPLWDAWVSAAAWAGMWLLTKRKIENWVLLNISNAFAIPLLFHKQLPLYALLTIFMFIVAIQGYMRWRKIIKTMNAQNPGKH